MCAQEINIYFVSFPLSDRVHHAVWPSGKRHPTISLLIPGYPRITRTVTYPRISQYKSGKENCFGVSKDKILVTGHPETSLFGITRYTSNSV